jgi:hypothetical protein
LTVLHIPLAMLTLAWAVWLTLREPDPTRADPNRLVHDYTCTTRHGQ